MSTALAHTPITPRFNLGVLTFTATLGIARFLLTLESAAQATALGLMFTVTLDLVRLLIVIAITSWIARAFWNRLICDVAPVRPLKFDEAVAGVLVLGLLVS